MLIFQVLEKKGNIWSLYDGETGFLIPMHTCNKSAWIKHGYQHYMSEWKTVKTSKFANFDDVEGIIFCPACYSRVPDAMMVAMKLSQSHKRLTKKAYGGPIDYTQHPTIWDKEEI